MEVCGKVLYKIISELLSLDDNLIDEYLKRLNEKGINLLIPIDLDYFNKIFKNKLDINLKKVIDELSYICRDRCVTLLDLLISLYNHFDYDRFYNFFNEIKLSDIKVRTLLDILNYLNVYYAGKDQEIDRLIDKLYCIIEMKGTSLLSISDDQLLSLIKQNISINNDYYHDILRDFCLKDDSSIKYLDINKRETDRYIDYDKLEEIKLKHEMNKDLMKDKMLDKLITDNIIDILNNLGYDSTNVICIGNKDGIYYYLTTIKNKDNKKVKNIYIPIQIPEYNIIASNPESLKPKLFLTEDKQYLLNKKGLEEFFIDEIVKVKRMQKKLLDELRLPYYDDSLRYLDIECEQKVVDDSSINEDNNNDNELYKKFKELYKENFSSKTIDYIRKTSDFVKSVVKNKILAPIVSFYSDTSGDAVVFEVKGFSKNGKVVLYIIVDTDGDEFFVDKIVYNGRVYDYSEDVFDNIFNEEDEEIVNPELFENSFRDLKKAIVKAVRKGNMKLVKKILKIIKEKFGESQYNDIVEFLETKFKNNNINILEEKSPQFNKLLF